MTSPMRYQFRVKETLSPQWEAWFDPLIIENQTGGETVLSGALPDQASLHGVLIRIRNLGLTLVSLDSTELDPPKETTRQVASTTRR